MDIVGQGAVEHEEVGEGAADIEAIVAHGCDERQIAVEDREDDREAGLYVHGGVARGAEGDPHAVAAQGHAPLADGQVECVPGEARGEAGVAAGRLALEANERLGEQTGDAGGLSG